MKSKKSALILSLFMLFMYTVNATGFALNGEQSSLETVDIDINMETPQDGETSYVLNDKMKYNDFAELETAGYSPNNGGSKIEFSQENGLKISSQVVTGDVNILNIPLKSELTSGKYITEISLIPSTEMGKQVELKINHKSGSDNIANISKNHFGNLQTTHKDGTSPSGQPKFRVTPVKIRVLTDIDMKTVSIYAKGQQSNSGTDNPPLENWTVFTEYKAGAAFLTDKQSIDKLSLYVGKNTKANSSVTLESVKMWEVGKAPEPDPDPEPDPEPTDEYIVKEDFNYYDLNTFFKSGYDVTTPNYEQYTKIGIDDGNLVNLQTDASGDVEIEKQLKTAITTGVYGFEVQYKQNDNARLKIDLLNSNGMVITSIDHNELGNIQLQGATAESTDSENGQISNKMATVRVMLDFDKGKILSGISADDKMQSKYTFQEKLFGNSEQGSVETHDLNKIRITYKSNIGDYRGGYEIHYMKIWQDRQDGQQPEFGKDDATTGGEMVLYEDKFGYKNLSELTAKGYSKSISSGGSEADSVLKVVDGYPMIEHINDVKQFVNLDIPEPSNIPQGEDLKGELILEYRYETNPDKNNYIASSISGAIDVFATDWGVTIKAGDGKDIGLSRAVSVMDWKWILNFDDKTFKVSLNGSQYQSGKFRYSSPTEMRTVKFTSRNNKTMITNPTDHNKGDGEKGTWLKLTKYKISKMKNTTELVGNAAKKFTSEMITPNSKQVVENLILPTVFEDINISWESVNETIIGSDGIIYPQAKDDVSTSIIATFFKSGVSIKRAFDFTLAATNPENYYMAREQFDGQLKEKWTINGDTVINNDNIAVLNGDAIMTVPDENGILLKGNTFVDIQMTNNAQVGKTSCYSVLAGNGNELVKFIMNDNKVTINYKDAEFAVNKPLAKSSVISLNIDTENDVFTAAINGEEILKDAVLISDADFISNIKVLSQGSTVKIEEVKAYFKTQEFVQNVTNQINFSNISTQKEQEVTRNLNLIGSPIDRISFQWQSSDIGHVKSDGTVVRDIKDNDVVLTLKATDNKNLQLKATKVFNVKVLGYDDNNVAAFKSATSSVRPVSGSDVKYLTDADQSTVFETRGTEKTASFVIDLTKETVIGNVNILSSNNAIDKLSLAVSMDNKNYKTIYEGLELLVRPNIEKARYVKITVTNKKDNMPLMISDIVIKSDLTDEQRINTDFSTIKMPKEYNLKDDFTVPAVGEWGTKLDFSSGNEKIAKINAPADNVVKVEIITPAKSESVAIKLNATYGNAKKEHIYNYSVKGKNDNPSFGGGGSGSSSGGGSGSGVVAPPVNQNIQKPEDEGSKLRDINLVPWAKDYIIRLEKNGVISGDINGNFNPNNNVTREEYIKMLVLTLGVDIDFAATVPFGDVESNSWYYPYVATAYKMGIVSGMSETKFGVGYAITREDMAVMTIKAIENANISISSNGNSIKFNDYNEISAYAVDSVNKMSKYNILNGDENGDFNPSNHATRSEAAKILCSIIQD